MKQLFSIVGIIMSLLFLVNCSPKLAKKTAEIKPVAVSERIADPAAIPVETEIPVPMSQQRLDMISEGENNSSAKLAALSNEQQLKLYSDMPDLRLEIGQKIYTQNCGKCHDLNKPDSRTADSWVTIMRTMGPKAKLNADKHMMVAGYLVKNAKK